MKYIGKHFNLSEGCTEFTDYLEREYDINSSFFSKSGCPNIAKLHNFPFVFFEEKGYLEPISKKEKKELGLKKIDDVESIIFEKCE